MADHPVQSDISIPALRKLYASGECTPAHVLAAVLARIADEPRTGVWIHILSRGQIDAQLAALEARRRAGRHLPLYGIPFAIKDNIDLAGVPTTAACPDFAYTPAVSAPVVQRLLDAGAVAVGKTNLDQFATGLVGTRSPYGACENAFDPEWISGGSSSGSAVAVAAGLVSFALGTDTAGSGRVPASFNGLVGLKPTRGLLPTRGVVPACRSLDCVSIFAATCEEAAEVFRIAAGPDEPDPLSRSAPAGAEESQPVGVVGVPAPDQLEFFGNAAAAVLFQQSLERVRELGLAVRTIDFAPFRRAAELLYEGPWVAERLLATRELLGDNPAALRPELRTILESARRITALDVFDGFQTLAALRTQADAQWRHMDALLLPTTGTIYRIAEVEADPLRLNRNLGYYTNFVNLLDLCALAVPNGVLPTGLPMGVTFIAPAFHDARLLELGARFHTLTGALACP